MAAARVRCWCFTSFLVTEPLTILDYNPVKFVIWQRESCPETHKEHYQGYIELNSKRTITGAKRLFNDPQIHLESRKGTQAQAIEYCRKSESSVPNTQYEYGIPFQQGHRSDLDAVASALSVDGYTADEVSAQFPREFIKYSKGIRELYSIQSRSRAMQDRPVDVVVLIGPPGAGKTRSVYQTEGYDYVYSLEYGNGGSLWFDGYDEHPVLLIDDFRGWIKYDVLLRLLDRYPFRCQVKGSYVYAAWSKVYITSNVDMEDWYPEEPDILALQRRIRTIVRLPTPSEPAERATMPGALN